MGLPVNLRSLWGSGGTLLILIKAELIKIQGHLTMRRVNCTVLKEEADGLESPPYPGELGQRIFENVSADGWQQWLQRQVLIINENQLSTADPEAIELLEQHMLGFLFEEGDLGSIPQGFAPRKK